MVKKSNRFEYAMKSVLQEEGGYSNNSADPGGETKFGISKRAHPEVDIYNLSVEEAINIYKKEYWNPSSADKLPERLQNFYFHMVVMSGQKQAVRTSPGSRIPISRCSLTQPADGARRFAASSTTSDRGATRKLHSKSLIENGRISLTAEHHPLLIPEKVARSGCSAMRS